MDSEIGNVRLMATSQAAEQLGMAVSSVHYLVQTGQLTPALKAPGKRGAYLFSAADVEALVAKREGGRA